MADVKALCNDRCGCAVPCPGDETCRCVTAGGTAVRHTTCSCGEHCSCNPCTCGRTTAAAGRGSCTCGAGCTCATCAA